MIVIAPSVLDDIPEIWPYKKTSDLGDGVFLVIQRPYQTTSDKDVVGKSLRLKILLPQMAFLTTSEIGRLTGTVGAGRRNASQTLDRLEKAARDLGELANSRADIAAATHPLEESLRLAGAEAAARYGRPTRVIELSLDDCRWWQKWLDLQRTGA